MRFIKLTLKPKSAFGTPLLGDTLFGQLCWSIHHRYGEKRLKKLLKGYTKNQPFAVVSDGFPSGYLPRPTIPMFYFKQPTDIDRKKLKKRVWMPVENVKHPICEWLSFCKSDDQLLDKKNKSFITKHIQPHNSINRLTGTTGEDGFAPYNTEQSWYISSTQLSCFVIFNEEKIKEDELLVCFKDIGDFGFGKDASIGMGKFSVLSSEPVNIDYNKTPNAFLTLSPCAPQGLGYDENKSYYLPFTRFGKHGDLGVHLKGKPFKNPILLTKTGAIFNSDFPENQFLGQGLGGDNKLSNAINNTVHQGYAPVIPVFMSSKTEVIK